MQIDARKMPLNGKRIGVFGKGGAGKSTFTVLLARVLRNRGYSVCVLDADSTNFGLSEALGISRPPRMLMDYFGGMVFSGGLVTCPVDGRCDDGCPENRGQVGEYRTNRKGKRIDGMAVREILIYPQYKAELLEGGF